MAFFKTIAPAIATGGLSLAADKLGLFKGKTDPADFEAQILKKALRQKTETEMNLLDRFKQREGEDVSKLIGDQVATEKSNLLRKFGAAGDDTERAFRQSMAQRGLGNSSIGLVGSAALGNQMRGKLAEKLAGVQSSLAQRIEDEKYKRLQDYAGFTKGMLAGQNVPLKMQDTKKKSLFSSLLPAAGMAAGAYFGGPSGAQIGGSLGNTFSDRVE